MIRTIILTILCAPLIAACSSSNSAAGGSKTNNIPLVLNLQTTPQEAWVGQPVAFSVTCLSAKGSPGNANLTYQWHFGDESSSSQLTAPASNASDVHVYSISPESNAANQYDTYQYYVVCQDNSFAPPVTARTPSQALNVLRQNLNSVSAGNCSSGVAGVGWCWQNPIPTGATVRAITALSPLNVWAVGDSGTVLETYDGGVTWQAKFLGREANGTVPNLYAVKATDQNNAFVLGGDGTIRSTTSAGGSWVTTRPASPLSLTAGVLIDASHAWAADGTHLFNTSDGGSSWSPAGNPLNVSKVTALDTQNIFAAGPYFETDTSDGGKTWSTPVELDAGTRGTTTGFGDIVSVSATRGSRCGNTDSVALAETVWVGAHIFQEGTDTTAGVLSWPRALPPAAPELAFAQVSSVTAFDGRTAWAGDPVFGQFAYTTEGNQNWQTGAFSTFGASGLYAFDSMDCKADWAVGSEGGVWNTEDGALDWQQLLPVADVVSGPNLFAVSSSSALQAFALGGSPSTGRGLQVTTYEVYATSDGTRWTTLLPPTTVYGNSSVGSISANASGQFVAVGNGYLAIYGGPQGVVSLYQDLGAFFDLTAVSMSATSAWIVGNYTSVWLLDINDSGTWSLMPPTPTTVVPTPMGSPLYGIATVSPTSAVAVGSSGGIYLLSYTAGTWQVDTVASPVTQDLLGISLAPNGFGWAVGQGGTILRTTDSGLTWKAQSWSDATVNFTSVSTADGQSGWIVGQDTNGVATVIYTCDGGTIWNVEDAGSQNVLAVTSVDTHTGWIVGQHGTILKTMTSGLVPAPGSTLSCL